MSQHITRKELKKDKFAETLAHGVEEVALHQKQVFWLVGVALLVFAAIVGWRIWSERQTVKAQAALDEAMKVYNARIRMPGEAADPNEITYTDDKNKFNDAAKKFEKVSADFGRTNPGRMARYYAGLSYAQIGNNEEAQKWLRMVEGSSDEELAALARFQLAGVLSAMGKSDDAAKLYQQLINKPSVLVPKALSMLALADHLAKSNPAEATKIYTQLETEFPNTSIAEQAKERLEELKPKS